jgi:hypothetical protein
MVMYDCITDPQAELLRVASLFFIASVHPDLEAGPMGEGPVNLSPKGMTPIHVLGPNKIAYLDYPGSGNETARHAAVGGPVALMVMSMDASDAAIVRLYGRATATPIQESPLADRLLAGAPSPDKARQVVEIEVDKTQTSCGFGVPIYEFVGERPPEARGRRFRQ